MMIQAPLHHKVCMQHPYKSIMIVVLSLFLCSLPVVAQIEQNDTEMPEEGSVTVRVLEVKENVREGAKTGTPAPGNRFVSVQVAVANTEGTEPELVDALFFYLKDAQDTQYQAIGGKDIPSDYVDVGETLEGWIWFELPESLELSEMSLRMLGVLRKTAWIPLSETGGSAAVNAMNEEELTILLQEFKEQIIFAYPSSPGPESLRKDIEQMGTRGETGTQSAIDFGETFTQVLEYLEQGNEDDAEILVRQALDEALESPELNAQAIALMNYILGGFSIRRQEYPQALEYYNQSLEIAREEFESDDFRLALILKRLGFAYHAEGDNAAALKTLEQALTIEQSAAELVPSNLGETLFLLGMVHYAAGAYPEAVTSLENALSHATRAFGREHENVIAISYDLGMAYKAVGENEKAIEVLSQSLLDGKTVYGSDHENIARTLYTLGRAYKDVGDYEQAIASHEQSLDIQRKIFDTPNENMAVTLSHLADAYYQVGDYARAIGCLEEAEQIFAATVGEYAANTKAVRHDIDRLKGQMERNTI